MGAKNSTSKKLEGSTRKDPTLSSSHDESLDENKTIDNNEKNRDITGVDIRREDNIQPPAGFDANQQPRLDVNPQPGVETNQPASHKPAQPKRSAGNHYEEITEEHLASNRKDKDDTQQDSTRISRAVSGHISTTEASRGPHGRGHAYEEIPDEQFIANRNIKQSGEKDNKKANEKPKEKNDKKKNKKEKTAQKEVVETSRSEALSGTSTAKQSPKPAARYHPYDEITTEQIETTKQKVKKKDNEDKKKVKEDKKKKKSMIESSSATVVDVVMISAQKESPKLARFHPYDEITEEQLKTRQKMMNGQKGNPKEKKAKDRQVVVEDSEDVEYQNMAVIKASKDQPNRDGGGGDDDGKTEEDDVANTYAVPQKKQLKVNVPSQLNYIEVEFNPATSKPEVKEPYSPTTYMSIVNENGKLVLSES